MSDAARDLATLLDLDPARIETTVLRHSGPGPRYTSYPTAPVWTEAYGPDAFRRDLGGLAAGAEISLYVHVPFCRSLCHFCACNRIITQRPEAPADWLDTIEREIALLRTALAGAPRVVQHHWGGGTPTHLEPAQIRRLFRALDDAFPVTPDAEVSIEVDPRVTSEAHIEALRTCGFGRLSMGVQDFDPRVQAAIHRVQSVASTAALVERARASGFASIGFDLIYGLPFQTIASMERTLDDVIAIAPDRIALYGYAHVTWVAKQQRGFERHDLPTPPDRLRIQLATIRKLLAAGYEPVGMDHFARPEDELAQAARSRRLRRNFMGYTTRPGLDLLALGPSAISQLETAFAQSHRDLAQWERAIHGGEFATLRGHALTADDRRRQWVIAELLCHGGVSAHAFRSRFDADFDACFPTECAALEPLAEQGLVEFESDGGLRITALGHLAMRPVAMVFDAYLPAHQATDQPVFSQTV
ncbi:oxygen-independent coproporphyrinogen III oxidase [Myxococcota bacterium]|nr:oxygen-independent coproporphyrinogen III oxidase [Myxococcota bacterium]MCZ7618195.1 oxygen-independent coproporphyrinogen III oxidase [Myxococcota bacterium]